jgi:hypothetical protein
MMKKLSCSLVLAAALAAVASSIALPTAGANPVVGQSCSGTDRTSPDGNLICGEQAGIWMHNDNIRVARGSHCTVPGDRRLQKGGIEQDTFTCRNGTWQ